MMLIRLKSIIYLSTWLRSPTTRLTSSLLTTSFFLPSSSSCLPERQCIVEWSRSFVSYYILAISPTRTYYFRLKLLESKDSHCSSMTSSRFSWYIYTRRVSSRLQHWMEHHPMVSNSVLCLKLWVAGDFLAQYSAHHQQLRQHQHQHQHHDDDNEQNENPSLSIGEWYDWQRTARCAGYGALFTGPILAKWYPYIDRVCGQYQVAARYGVWGPPMVKVVADEFLIDPPMICAFFGYMAFWEQQHEPHHTITTTSTQEEETFTDLWQSKLQSHFFPTWYTSLVAWPPILLATFRFFPVYAQAPIINVCCILWDAFLSHRNALDEATATDTTTKQGQDKDVCHCHNTRNKTRTEEPSSSSIVVLPPTVTTSHVDK
jgi:Mpv17 / PMP22 family